MSSPPSCSRTQPSDAAGPSAVGCDATSPEESTKKTRKRQRKFEEWKSTQRKAKRNKGESYVSKRGKEVGFFYDDNWCALARHSACV